LLKKALTHTSYANENNVESNEKLEYLGDSILEFISSKYLFDNYKELKEGEMTKVRATVVCEESLHKIALKHNFSDFLYLGKSESSNSANLSIENAYAISNLDALMTENTSNTNINFANLNSQTICADLAALLTKSENLKNFDSKYWSLKNGSIYFGDEVVVAAAVAE
jgi:dsRNA-specific ribonuclease